ncbi:hypothetical protein [Entomobacter blattae]|uniref:Uncharacterized protein n=1 Tax=Entomobacter blattae TaxID=2762277 RepID=A0A7H1NU12_9PROT|nr:hypothetical protein [Entomobacter blattae]QNT79272.1 hypothetical protein JGUZn3_20670 [Entomobacter blattae]
MISKSAMKRWNEDLNNHLGLYVKAHLNVYAPRPEKPDQEEKPSWYKYPVDRLEEAKNNLNNHIKHLTYWLEEGESDE